MIRMLWLALSAAAAIILATLLQDAAHPFLESFAGAPIPDDPLVALAGMIASGVLIFALMGFAVPAIVEGGQVMLVRRNIRRLGEETIPGSPINEAEFRAAFAASPVFDDAAEHAAGFFVATTEDSESLRQNEDGTPAKVQAVLPANRFFGAAQLVDARLRVWLFRPLPTFLWGLAVIIAVFAFARAGSATNWGALVAVAAWGFALPAVTAVILQLVTRLLSKWRQVQADELCAILDSLLGFSPNQTQTQDILTAAREQAAIIEDALREPLARLTKASTQLSEDQSAQVQQVLRSTLKSFIGEVQGLVGQQINDVHGVLKQSTDIAHKLERSLTDSARTLTKFSKTQSTEMSEALDRYRAALTSFEEKSRSDFGADFKVVIEKLDHSATAFKDATSGAEALNQTVAPLLSELVATQTALLRAIEGLKVQGAVTVAAREPNDQSMLDRVKSLNSSPKLPQLAAASPALNADFNKLRSLVGGSELPEL